MTSPKSCLIPRLGLVDLRHPVLVSHARCTRQTYTCLPQGRVWVAFIISLFLLIDGGSAISIVFTGTATNFRDILLRYLHNESGIINCVFGCRWVLGGDIWWIRHFHYSLRSAMFGHLLSTSAVRWITSVGGPLSMKTYSGTTLEYRKWCLPITSTLPIFMVAKITCILSSESNATTFPGLYHASVYAGL